MSRNEPDFDRDLQAAFHRMRDARGACPAPETLASYLRDSLAANERERVERHIAGCGLCDCLLEKLQSFEAPSPAEIPVNWPPAERRMRRRVFAQAGTWWRGMLQFLAKPVLGYGVAVVALGWAYWSFPEHRLEAPAPPPAAPPAALERVRSIDLNVKRGATSKSAADADEQRILLSFFVPVRPGFRYRAAIDRGDAVDIASYDGIGNFHLLCNGAQVRPGKHLLTVTEINPATAKTERSVDFEFHR
jgi:hypothetical protein